MTTKDPQEWARKINISMASSVAAIIETGRAFLDAKKELAHGDFQRLFANHPDPLPEPVSCSPGTAQRLMKIASNPVLAKPAHAPVLPCSWMTLYELTKVPDDRLEIALQEGWIRPGLAYVTRSRMIRPRVDRQIRASVMIEADDRAQPVTGRACLSVSGS